MSQSETGRGECEYPAAYVDPRPAFWKLFTDLANNTAAILRSINYSEQSDHVKFFESFANVTTRLEQLSQKEPDDVSFTEDEVKFLKCSLVKGRNDCETDTFAYSGTLRFMVMM